MGLMDLPPLMRNESDVSGDVTEGRGEALTESTKGVMVRERRAVG